jgi:hypothetical protein
MPKPPAPLAHIVLRRPTLRLTLPLAALTLAAGCLDRPISPAQPTTTNLFVNSLPNHLVDKADLLFMIDNSVSMADKQEILAKAVPVLVKRLATPRCLDAQGQPNGSVSDVNGHCTSGRPEFAAVKDIHVGVVTSSLGNHGGTECTPTADDVMNGRTPDDRAELLPTANQAVRGSIDSYDGTGFLAWDAGQKDTPPGSKDIADFGTEFGSYVQKAGENGCGYESSLEAWYRFLIDPAPPENVTSAAGSDGIVVNHLGPVNQVVLDQRKAFLRPDSLLAIVMLTDENDCSVIDDDGTQGWLVTELTDEKGAEFHLPRASAACAASPDDPCCHSCAAPAPSGCTPNASDAECSKKSSTLEKSEDGNNLRCFEQKRRFGLDLLYPLQRYVDGLTKSTVRDRSGQEVPNPIFQASGGQPPRPKNLVLLAGIVGVPWQDIASDDSLTGPGLSYLTASELTARSRWATILGGSDGSPPADPLMIESIAPRTGTNPILGAALAPPSTDLPGPNPINGHEMTIPDANDLQYSCIFELPTPRQCDGSNADSCDCTADDQKFDRPLCDFPNGPNTDGIQRYAKAYPGLRELGVLKGVGDNGIVASICAKHAVPAAGLAAEADASYGYNPAVAAMGDIIRSRLARQCLPRQLSVQKDPKAADFGAVPCDVVSALPKRDGACACDATRGNHALGPDDAKLASAVDDQLEATAECGKGTGISCDDFCLCKIDALSGDKLSACQNGTESGADYGYCYVDPAQGIGNPVLTADCPSANQRSLRFVGDGLLANGSVTFMACVGSNFEDGNGVTSLASNHAASP